MTQITISNVGGTLNCDAIKYREGQACKVPTRDIPSRTTGSFVDVGTWTLKNRRLYMTTRLTDAEKTTLLAILNASALITITVIAGTDKTWTYTGWLKDKDIVYEYSKETALEPWRCDLIFNIGSFSYRLIILSTVTSGSLSPPNSCKPYYYNGYYYVFYVSSGTIYYKKSTNGGTWGSAVSVASSQYHWSVMGIDDKILLVRIDDNYFKVRVGTIEADHTITWGSDTSLGGQHTNWKFCWCYATKIGGSRKMFVNTTGPINWYKDYLWVSDTDGNSWTNLGFCDPTNWLYYWKQYQAIPFDVDNKIQEISSPHFYSDVGYTNYKITGTYRDGGSCSALVVIDDYRNQWYLGDQANAILIGSYVHLVYIDNANNLLHKKVSAGGSWTTVGTVKAGVNADAGVTLCYDSAKAELHIIYYEDTTIKQKIWDGTEYGGEDTIIEGETNILRLTAYPTLLNNRILLTWQDATPNIRFGLLTK